MKIRRLISLILLMSLIVSCAPVLERATMPPDVDKTIKMRIAKSDSVLILPIWRKVPFIYSGLKASSYLISSPVITSGREITTAYNKLPKPLNYGFVGPACQVGSELVFQGLYVITDNREIVWLQHNVTPANPDWSIIKSSALDADWKTIIEDNIKNSKSIELQTNADKAVWGAFEGNNERMTCSLEFSQKERNMILGFLDKVPTGNTHTSAWTITSKR